MDEPFMKKYIFLMLLSSLTMGFSAEEDEKEQISFYRGYLLWEETLRRPGMEYDFEKVIAGMRAAEEGKPFDCEEATLVLRIRAFQEALLEKQAKENLADAEEYLSKMALETVELVPGKLYYKQLKKGEGKSVQSNGTPIVTYTTWVYNREGEEEVFSRLDPFPIILEGTIPGFAQGVVGMLEGEVRQLYIHPDLAYGVYGKLDPNVLVIFKVEVISADDKEGSFS